MGKTIGVISLKGGVGKTSSVVSLGSALADFGKRVLLVDGNFSAPNLGIHLNIIEPPVTLHHVLNRSANVQNAIHRTDKFDILPSSVFNKLNINPLKLRDHLSPLKKKYDLLVVDSPPSLNEEVLAAILASDDILVVATPDYPTLSMTLKSIKTIKQRGVSVAGLILNKVHDKNFELSIDDIESTIEAPVLAVIPYDVGFGESLYKFKSFVDHKPKSAGSEEYRRLAASLIGERYKPVKLKKFFKWINPKKQDINREIYYQSVL